MLHQLEKWSTTHHPRWLVVLRVALGICLILKGISFLSNSVNLSQVLKESNVDFGVTWLPVLISSLHLLCGFLIITGLLTRWATLVMIPILLVAVVFINAPRGIYAGESEFGFSLIVLLLLIFFFIEGGGPLSLDDFFKKNPK